MEHTCWCNIHNVQYIDVINHTQHTVWLFNVWQLVVTSSLGHRANLTRTWMWTESKLLSSSLSSALCTVFAIIYLKQTMFFGYIVLQLFCIYSPCYMSCYFTHEICFVLYISTFCSMRVQFPPPDFVLSRSVAQVLSEWFWNGSSRPYYYWYYCCSHIPHVMNLCCEVFIF